MDTDSKTNSGKMDMLTDASETARRAKTHTHSRPSMNVTVSLGQSAAVAAFPVAGTNTFLLRPTSGEGYSPPK